MLNAKTASAPKEENKEGSALSKRAEKRVSPASSPISNSGY